MDPRGARGVDEEPGVPPRPALLSVRCTTGWLDWVHGELWLLPDGLLRVCDGEARSSTDGARTPPDADELTGLCSQARTLWVPADEIARASVRCGILTSRLTLQLSDGGRRKLLWPSSDSATPVLRYAFANWQVALA
jgi:hypothetical protein